jgi:ParB family chromosome partitioning protein
VSTQPRLGRGLAALMGDTTPDRPTNESGAPTLGTVQSLSIDTLEPGPFQPRRSMAPGAMDELVESIKARGILQPILARRDPANPKRYQIIAGERRWRAAQSAGLHDVPVLLRELSDRDAMAASLVENLHAIEEAEGYQRLLQEFGLTQEQLGAAVGKSRSHIANTIRLLQLPAAVRTEVQNGRLSAGHARALLAHANPEQAARQVLADGLNVRQTEALTTNAKPEKTRNQENGKPRDPETEALERDLSEKLGLKVQIAFDGHGGSVRISYRSLDQLDGLIAVLSR